MKAAFLFLSYLLSVSSAQASTLHAGSYLCDGGARLVVDSECERQCTIEFTAGADYNHAHSVGMVAFLPGSPFGGILNDQHARVGTIRVKRGIVYLAIATFSTICE